MYNNSFFKAFFIALSVVSLVSCDKDFNSVGGSLIEGNHFDLSRYTSEVVSYNQKIGPVQSSNLPVNPLGVYDDPVFGSTEASFVTQLSLATVNPAIGANPEIESVVLSVPYFSTVTSTDLETGDNEYQLDSIYGPETGKIKLSIYESGYYMRDLDPLTGFSEAQPYYTNQATDFENLKVGPLLNDSIVSQNEEFVFDANEIRKTTTVDGAETTTRTAPEMRLALNKDYFKTRIIAAAASGKLVTNDIFRNYFRGLYFKVEKSGSNEGRLAMINFKSGTVTINYKEDLVTTTTVDGVSTTTTTRERKSIVFNMSGNTVSLQSNANATAYQNATNPANVNSLLGDDRLYVKGGEGSMTVLELFKAAGELDMLRSKDWLINEANLVFHVDQSKMDGKNEPNRLYIYDLTHNKPVADYLLDGTSGSNPKNGQYVFGGLLNKTNAEDVVYKFRITNQIKNLINHADSTNVKLGVVVTESIGNSAVSKLRQSTSTLSKAPQASVMSPLGTVLYGGTSNVPDNKRLKLEIYYTEPN